jgi:hypothetical protein
MRVRRSTIPVLFILALAVVATGCHSKVTFETPTAQHAYYANEALKQVGILQTDVINLEAAGKLPTATTRVILLSCRVADLAIPASTAGWKAAAVTAAWEAARSALKTPTGNDIGVQPLTWQAGVTTVWAALKVKVALLQTDPTLSVVAVAIDTALAQIGG